MSIGWFAFKCHGSEASKPLQERMRTDAQTAVILRYKDWLLGVSMGYCSKSKT